jgi:hypothetical protein
MEGMSILMDAYGPKLNDWQNRYQAFRDKAWHMSDHGGDTYAMFNYINYYMENADNLLYEINMLIMTMLEDYDASR